MAQPQLQPQFHLFHNLSAVDKSGRLLLVLEALNTNVAKIQQDIATLKDDVTTLKADVRTLKDDVRTLKEDVKILKDDVRTLKEDVTIMKNDVKILKEDVMTVKSEVECMGTRIDSLLYALSSRFRPLDTNLGRLAGISTRRLVLSILWRPGRTPYGASFRRQNRKPDPNLPDYNLGDRRNDGGTRI